ncbi:MAG: hypothetical protein KGL39_36325 [Patescibacteria group bacterium]|nr:hypothetical protein [Patescibacteria group bacterium]
MHKVLVRAAVKWLTGAQHCGAVLAEISTTALENPDAIGWQAHKSLVVECKASRSDFLAQKNKPCVRIGRLVGNERFYLCPEGVIKPEDLEGTGYGLIWWDGKSSRMQSKAEFRSLDPVELLDERTMLVSALRRIQTREFLTIVPAPESHKEGQQ